MYFQLKSLDTQFAVYCVNNRNTYKTYYRSTTILLLEDALLPANME
jgi:hypothetical protein